MCDAVNLQCGGVFELNVVGLVRWHNLDL